MRIIQNSSFSKEIEIIKRSKGLNSSRLATLNPFIDEIGLLRVGGRLRNSDIADSQKCPILLPSKHNVTKILIRETHENFYHTGVQSTLNHIRQKFWLIDGKQQVRSVIQKCNCCFRHSAKNTEYRMGDLPAVRVRGIRSFCNVGVDFCGPFFIKEKKFRNRGKIKAYVSVFVCLAMKAVHLEVVSEMTTEGFINALKRFIDRRGIPTKIVSDNGTNFHGTNNQLKELFALMNSDEFKKEDNDFAFNKKIVWQFSPPLAPHFGGIWEAAVKSFKHHFKRVVGNHLFTYEEMNTFVIEIEAILNSRPLCSMSSDPNDPQALTAGHFLIGQPITLLPEKNLISVSDNRLSSWQLITKAKQIFWKRWYFEYLSELQNRQKWYKNAPNIERDTIVLIKDKNLPCARWRLGRIIDVYPGDDGVIRTARIQTADTELTRCVQLLCPLPTQ